VRLVKNPEAAPTAAHNDDVSWFAFAAAPTAVTLHQVGLYAMTPLACQRWLFWPLHVTTAAALILVLSGIAVAWRDSVRNAGAMEGAELPGRSRFIAVVVLACSILLLMVIVAQAIAFFYFQPCQR
jgi:hypothetical protein